MVQGLRQDYDDSAATKEEMLCLYHWRQAHVNCSSGPDVVVVQQRSLDHQLQQITALDKSVEAYLARFKASK
jgi:hypothetical protein